MIIIENGEQFKQFREQIGYTIKQFERVSGLAHGTLCNFENGKHVKDSTIKRIEKACNDIADEKSVFIKDSETDYIDNAYIVEFTQKWEQTVKKIKNRHKPRKKRIYNKYGYHRTSSGVMFGIPDNYHIKTESEANND